MEKEQKSRTYYVYVHINKINSKRYYGITSQLPKERWKRGSSYKNQPKFYNAILKYGWDNFEHIVLYSNLTKKEATALEVSLIEEFKTTDNTHGYNVSIGGEHSGQKYKTAEEAYAQRLENCKKCNRRKLKQIQSDPILHQQLLEEKRASYARQIEKLKQDPAAYAKYLEAKRKANHKRFEDPEKHAALLKWRREYHAKNKINDTKNDTV